MKLNFYTIISAVILITASFSTNAQNALSFDGIDDYVSVPNASAQIANKNLSLSFWVYPTNPAPNYPNFDGFAGFRNNSTADFYILHLNTTSVEARFRNSAGTNFDIVYGGVVLNTWNHFAMTYNGSTLTLYHNGVSVGTQTATGSITSTTETLYLGSVPFGGTNFLLNGQLDDACLWTKSLTASEVSDLYIACSVDITSNDLGLCYEFNQGTAGGNNTSVPSALDSKGNINGTFNGFALTGSTSNYVAHSINAISTVNVNLCDVTSYTSPQGNTYTSSGSYQETIMNGSVSGCDSVITINLTLGSSTNNTSINPSACGSYTAQNGQVYTTSGTYTDTLMSAAGCDSVITLNLTINQPTSSTINVQACNSFFPPSGGDPLTASGTYTDIISNAAGCDSIITINLTIENNTGTSNITACGSHTTPEGTVLTSSGNYTVVFTNSAGCDSTVTVNVTINPVPDATVSQNVHTLTADQNGMTYQWIDCATNMPIANETNQSFTPTADGNYAVIVTDNGCSDTSSCVMVQPVNTVNIFEENITAFPNPTSGQLQIDLGAIQEEVQLTIISIIGKQLNTATYQQQQNIQLDMSNYPKGVYLLQLQSKEKQATLKIIVD